MLKNHFNLNYTNGDVYDVRPLGSVVINDRKYMAQQVGIQKEMNITGLIPGNRKLQLNNFTVYIYFLKMTCKEEKNGKVIWSKNFLVSGGFGDVKSVWHTIQKQESITIKGIEEYLERKGYPRVDTVDERIRLAFFRYAKATKDIQDSKQVQITSIEEFEAAELSLA